MADIDLVRDVLDKQLVDLHEKRMGKADGVILVLEGDGPPRVKCIEAALHRRRAEDRPGTHPPTDTLEVLPSKVFKLEQVAHELSGAFRNDHAVWLRDAL